MDGMRRTSAPAATAETPATTQPSSVTSKKTEQRDVKMQGLAQQTPLCASQPAKATQAAAALSGASVARSERASSSASRPKRAIELMADYGAHPLWEASPDAWGEIDPDTLPISAALKKDLRTWADIYEAILNLDNPRTSGFKSEAEERQFEAMGEDLAKRLRKELPKDDFEVRAGIRD